MGETNFANIFNDFFSHIESNIGFNDGITSAGYTIIDHQNHPNILKTRASSEEAKKPVA